MNAIRIARELSAADPELSYVPVLWMATEDHDRDEIDHVFLEGQKIRWQGDVAGPVGRMPLAHIDQFLREVKDALGVSTNARTLIRLIESCYRPEFTLAKATRLFCHALFGDLGLLILDADHRKLNNI